MRPRPNCALNSRLSMRASPRATRRMVRPVAEAEGQRLGDATGFDAMRIGGQRDGRGADFKAR